MFAYRTRRRIQEVIRDTSAHVPDTYDSCKDGHRMAHDELLKVGFVKKFFLTQADLRGAVCLALYREW